MSTLNENILKVKETLNEIATAIKEQGVSIDECTSPESYGEKIKSIGENIELDADKIHTKAYDVGDLDPRVEVSNTEDGKILFTFGLKRGPQGPAGPAGPSGSPGPAGLNGVPGRDASQIEYIYKPVPTEETIIETPNNSQEDNYIPKLEGWFGEPQGVTGVFQVEYCCIRKKIDGIWGDWSKPSICARWGKDGEPGKDGIDGEPGRGIVSVEKLFAVNNDPNEHPAEGWTTIENVSTSSTNRYMWCQETTTFTSGDPTVIHYIVAIEGEPGANGTGNDAPIIYPAGVWDDEKEYESTDDKVPYVYYLLTDENGDPTEESGYYMLQEGLGKYTSNITPDLDSNWKKIDSFEAIYSDIGLFNQALVGKWVFHGDYMFSQEGVDASGNSKKYSDFTDPKLAVGNGEFIPNICLNAVTGEGWFAGKNIVFNKDGSGYVGNKTIEWSNEYSLINESSCTIDVYGAKDPEIGSEPIPKTNVLHINAIAGNGDIGYNKSHELVLNLSNYKFVGENLKITNYSDKLIYLHCNAAGDNAMQYFMKEGFDVYWGDNNVSTNYSPNFIETFVLQPYSEVQFRLVTIPSLYTTEDCQYIIVITPVSYFYRNNQQCLTNTSVYDFDFDLKLNSLSKNNFEFNTCTSDDQYRVFQWSDINFDFIRAIEDGDRKFIDDSEQIQLKIYEGELEKITVDGFANKFIKTSDLKNAECFIDIDTRPYWRFQLYYKNVCFAELKSTIDSHPC